MTLYDLVNQVEAVAKAQPSVATIVPQDVYDINTTPNLKYGAFSWLHKQHSTSASDDMMTYRFVFFYVDRLTADKANMLEVQSVGIETLDNICKTLYDSGMDVSDYTFQPFNQRFTDDCSGVMCDVTIRIPKNGNCGIIN